MPQGAKYVPTPEQRELVLLLAAGGVTHDLIAASVKCSEPTLYKHFKTELTTGQRQITALAVSSLVRAMKNGGKGSVAAACFWLKCRERWTERHELTGADGSPLLGGPLKVIVEYEDK
jgi:hypothetical protein